jgi:N-acetylneuraminic acid mutarotase
VVGGFNNGHTETVYRTTINDDGTLNDWETLPDFPISFMHAKPLLIKDRIYIFGVYDGSGTTVYYATYDSNGNIGTWNYVGNMPNNIRFSAMVCTDNYVFSISGYNLNSNQYTNATYRAPILADGSIGTWTQITNGPITAEYAQLVIVGNKIYFIGGYEYYYNSAIDDYSYRVTDNVYSASFTSGITDYTQYYTDQPNTSPTFNLPDYSSKEAVNPGSYYYIKT